MRVCCEPGCPTLTDKGRCAEHSREQDRRRGTSHARGYTAGWRKARLYFLSANPLCVSCMSEGRVEAATVVDHIEPHRGSHSLFWDMDNWQSLCKPCHDAKTGRGE